MLNLTFLSAVNAGVIDTETYVETIKKTESDDKKFISDWLSRQDVANRLTQFGVSPDQAIERVASLSDADAQRLASEIEQAPAGGFIGVVVFIFLLLLLTDILGLTKVFSFTRSVRR
ncbi:MAG: PA2779 family protein [Burkholderiales bacterium]|jgi:hypothetical protein|nr:PA2779 family protein [Burkholderiales bacterium]